MTANKLLNLHCHRQPSRPQYQLLNTASTRSWPSPEATTHTHAHAACLTGTYARPPRASSLPPVCQRLGACHGLRDDGRVLDRSVGGHPGQLLPGRGEQDLLRAAGPCLLSARGKSIS